MNTPERMARYLRADELHTAFNFHVLLAPWDAEAIRGAIDSTGADVHVPGAIVRCVLESLAAGYARAIELAAEVTAQPVEVIHVGGGGSQNDLLCRLTAAATQVPVIAGAVEATALGNVLVQARSIGAAPSTLEGLRELVAASTELRGHDP